MYKIKTAIAIYLNRKEDFIDWGTEVVVDEALNIILQWNVTNVTQPTEQQLMELFNAEILNRAKAERKAVIKSQYNYNVKFCPNGCTTSVMKNGSEVVIDARRNETDNDLQNFEKLLDYMNWNNIDSMTIRDFYNQYLVLSKYEVETIIKDIVSHGLVLLQRKWQKENEIEACTDIETIQSINF